MEIVKVSSAAAVGIEGHLVEIEADISGGLPHFTIVGLPDAAVQESRERVRAAIKNSGCTFPGKRVTANLAPGDLRKEGPAYDLPIAVAVLLSSGQVSADVSQSLFLGELALNGTLRHTQGILPMIAFARDMNFSVAFVPAADAKEAALISGIDIIPVNSMGELVAHLRGEVLLQPFISSENLLDHSPIRGWRITDLSHIKGQEQAKRALEVAATGGHNLMMSGPPGSGKTMLACSLSSILPQMTESEALDVTKIYSVSGLLPTDTPLITQRPFRAPHYTISHAGLVGGGRLPRPGEISLCHRGVLFLDEFPEFGHAELESLRQPLEDKVITISRANGNVTFPANFMLVAAMNPCPCGYYGDSLKECRCSSNEISRYQKRISGPMLDRLDIFTEVPRVDYDQLTDDRLGESSENARLRVKNARQLQLERFRGTDFVCNSEMTPIEVRKFCQIDNEGQSLLRTASNRLLLSARAIHRILKVSRSIADLENTGSITTSHLAEAIQYRPRSLNI